MRPILTLTLLLHLSVLLMSMTDLGFTQDAQEVCPDSCRCLDKSSIITCRKKALTSVPHLLSTTMVLDMDYNRINIIYNDSFTSGPRIEILSMENNGIIHVDAGAFVPLSQLRILRLGNNHLSYLPQNLFWNNGELEVLDIHGNAFVEIPDNVMYHLHSLQLLNVSYNHLTTPLLGAGFKFTTQLSSVDLTGNNFVALESHVFQATLWWDEHITHYLNLSYCNIRHIHPNALSQLYRLEALTLEGNNEIPHEDLQTALRDLEVSSLQDLNLSKMNISDVFEFFSRFQHRNLVNLDLSYNNIREIRSRTFYYLVNLRSLDLGHNVLESIGDLSGLARLEYLYLDNNNIKTIQHTSFEGLQALTFLDMSHNSLTTIAEDPFQTLWDLHTLDISCNEIATFVINAGLENLETLYASHNKISNLASVRRLLRLNHLDLSHNEIVRLDHNVFSRGHSLKYVNFSHNLISEIDKNAFDSSAQEELDLSYNHISLLSNYAWKRMKKLHLRGNKIENISAVAFHNLNALLSLDLGENVLHDLPTSGFADIYNLRELSLARNPLGTFLQKPEAIAMLNSLWKLESLNMAHVDMEGVPSSMFANLTLLKTLDLSGNTLSSLTQSNLHGLSRLLTLNLSDNLFTAPDPKAFSHLVRLQKLDLSNNPFECTCELMPFRNWILSTNVTLGRVEDKTTYRCVGPPEWTGIFITDFSLQSKSCSRHEKAVIFAAVSCTILAIALTVVFIIYRYKYSSRHKVSRTQYCAIDESSAIQINPHNREWV